MTVTLRVRVWIEIPREPMFGDFSNLVTLRVRVWIEISTDYQITGNVIGHPPCEGVD